MTGAELKQYRMDLGMSQRQLSRVLRVPQPTIARWETGAIKIGHDKVLELAMKRLTDGRIKDLLVWPDAC